MRTTQLVHETPGDRKPTSMHDDAAAIANGSAYYDPDSAAYDEPVAALAMTRVESTEEGLPVRELVTA
jgi:hypothetical protein